LYAAPAIYFGAGEMKSKGVWIIGGVAVLSLMLALGGGQGNDVQPVAASASTLEREEFVRTCVAVELAQTNDQFITSDEIAPFAQLCREIFERQGGREWYFGRLQAQNPQLAQAYRSALLP
jgi:hypothetical protein